MILGLFDPQVADPRSINPISEIPHFQTYHCPTYRWKRAWPGANAVHRMVSTLCRLLHCLVLAEFTALPTAVLWLMALIRRLFVILAFPALLFALAANYGLVYSPSVSPIMNPTVWFWWYFRAPFVLPTLHFPFDVNAQSIIERDDFWHSLFMYKLLFRRLRHFPLTLNRDLHGEGSKQPWQLA